MWAFANSDQIRRAIHAKPISAIGKFDECSDRIVYNHNLGSMLPIHEELLHKGAVVIACVLLLCCTVCFCHGKLTTSARLL